MVKVQSQENDDNDFPIGVRTNLKVILIMLVMFAFWLPFHICHCNYNIYGE